MDAIIKALTQYALCIIAKDAGSRYPNPGRMLRNVGSIVQGTNDLHAGGTVQDQMATLLTGLQGAKTNAVPTVNDVEQGITIEQVTEVISEAFKAKGL